MNDHMFRALIEASRELGPDHDDALLEHYHRLLEIEAIREKNSSIHAQREQWFHRELNLQSAMWWGCIISMTLAFIGPHWLAVPGVGLAGFMYISMLLRQPPSVP